jgi:hypothetical protein
MSTSKTDPPATTTPPPTNTPPTNTPPTADVAICAAPELDTTTLIKLLFLGLIPVICLILGLLNHTYNNNPSNKSKIMWTLVAYFFISSVAFIIALFTTLINYYDFSNLQKTMPYYLLVAPLVFIAGFLFGGGYCIDSIKLFKPNCLQ